VGRLVTDEAFRQAFVRKPQRVIEGLIAQGMALTDTEVRPLLGTRTSLWSEVGEQIDPNLQKASLSGE
jgi:hypothetical protein